MKFYKYDIYAKNNKNKYELKNEMTTKGIHILQDFLDYNERKVDGEKIRIVKHYNFYPQMDIDVYFNNGYKYSYYDIPCNSGARIDSQELINE